MHRSVFSLTVFLLVQAFCLVPLAALAHVSADDMPDSVAEVEYSIFLEFQPNDKAIRNKLGMVYYRLNKLDESVREFSRVLKLDPKNYDALDGMGLVKSALQDYDAAIDFYQQAISINSEDMVGYFHLGGALEKKGLIREAAAAYRTSLAKYEQQYPGEIENKQAAEFGKALRAALENIEARK